ncbi:lysophospholipase [Leptolyngbya sp. DQ-M1]|uniref:alpha/beta hydrolase n=1 Tax=Leptolyngbya sp. DQ-M1 TaxID=2933920 RepID=UPI0032995025
MTVQPQTILFAQHGMTDLSGSQTIARLAHALALKDTLIVAPELHWVRTLFYLEPLIQSVQAVVSDTLSKYPDVPIRIIATSMGGVLWVELLDRHPEWWSRVHSLVLLGAPIGGSHIARKVDPFGWGIGIARDLGINRSAIAQRIAAEIPTLVVASDCGDGHDGVVTVESAVIHGAEFVCLSGVSHPDLRIHSAVMQEVWKFWANIKETIDSK